MHFTKLVVLWLQYDASPCNAEVFFFYLTEESFTKHI